MLEQKCQKVDWEAHKLECKALVEYTKARKAAGGKDADKVPDTPLRALGRILWSKAKKGESFVSSFNASADVH